MMARKYLRNTVTVLCSGALVAALGALTVPANGTAAVGAQEASTSKDAPERQTVTDDLPDPLSEKAAALREEAIADVLSGERSPVTIDGETVVKMGKEPVAQESPSPYAFNHPQRAADPAPVAGANSKKGLHIEPGPGGTEPGRNDHGREGRPQRSKGYQDQYVQLSREDSDNIFVILVEFGDERHPLYPDQDTDPETPGPFSFDGPVHNQIPKPDRPENNTAIWQPTYERQHYQDLYFSGARGANSLKNYYEKQSSGRYTVDGEVTDWVKVNYNEARYGRGISFNPDGSVACRSTICPNVWEMVEDGVEAWVDEQLAVGKSMREIRQGLSKFDEWDRNDYDGDGDFNEPDGYIDHFQILHAGEGEAADARVYGEDAVWSHSWYVNATDIGVTGPDYNPAGGAEIGSTGLWVGNYLTEPENAGIGVLAHEYGHDLGLPDEYDTTYTGESSAGFWTLMASGSYMSLPKDEGIGTRAVDLGAWDKLQLGWLDYVIATPGKSRRYTLGPAEYNSRKPQGMVVVLPDKQVTTEYGEPYAGERMWWSAKGNDLSTTMTREFDLAGVQGATMTLRSRYQIEEGYDYLYAQASTDGGETWSALDGTVDGEPFPRDGGGRPALTGSTGGEWAEVSIPMDEFAGQTVKFRFLYRTDPAVVGDGFFADQLVVAADDGTEVFSDGAESGDNGWNFDGFTITSGTETNSYDHFYVVGNKNYVSHDKTLKYGPYNFGFLPERPNHVEHFPYQDGLLISYWDTSYNDNNVGQHPGHGLILPIDAHPRPKYNIEGQPWRTRIQVYDATFGRQRVDSFTLHVGGKPSYVRGGRARRTFNDRRKYWYASKPDAGVKVPDTGTRIRVRREPGTSVRLRVRAPAMN